MYIIGEHTLKKRRHKDDYTQEHSEVWMRVCMVKAGRGTRKYARESCLSGYRMRVRSAKV